MLENYIDKAEPKGPLFSCARIRVEVDIEKVLQESINIFMDGWEHLKKVDYDQIPFKCMKFHEYVHFVKNFPKVVQEIPEKNQEEGAKYKQGKV